VVDACANIAGPYATMILAQLGADVIKLEPPQGDDARRYADQYGGHSIVHHLVGAGKRNVAIDVKTEDGLEAARRLIDSADVFVQSMRPGVAERLGLGHDDLKRTNANLLYYDISGYGTGSVGRSLPGYDPLVQAFSGIMDMTGHPGGPPTRCAPSVVDLGTGQWVALGIVAALMSRSQGQPVTSMETALVDTAFSLVGYQATSARITGKRPAKAGSGNPIAAPYQCYSAKDGWLLIAAPSQRLWRALVHALGREELAEDPRFQTVDSRSAHREALESELNDILETAETEEWIERLSAQGVPVGRVAGLEEAVVSDIAAERGTFVPSGDVPLVRLPLLVEGTHLPWSSSASATGEHTREVLHELGYSSSEVDGLVSAGCVVVP